MQRLERKHLMLRTRLKRLARKAIGFSKKQFFHDGLITLFTDVTQHLSQSAGNRLFLLSWRSFPAS